jgi:hypothetical protein
MKPLESGARPPRRALELQSGSQIAELRSDIESEIHLEPIATLPREHPAWHRDVAELSERALEAAGRLVVVTLQIFGFWDHALRSLTFGTQRVFIDSSGSYRLE